MTCEVCGGPCGNKYSVCRSNGDCKREYRRRAQDAVLERLREDRGWGREGPGWDAVLEQAGEYQQRKREAELTAQQREREGRRRRHRDNQDQEREYNRAWRQGNPELLRAQGRRHHQRHLEEDRAYGRERYLANRDQLLEYGNEYRAALRSTVSGTARLMFLGARARARKADLPFDLTAEWMESELALTLENGCPLTGTEITLGSGPRSAGTPSVDRFRPELGYVQDNCWVVSWAANSTKRNMTISFIERVLAMADTRFSDAALRMVPDRLDAGVSGDPVLRAKARAMLASARGRARRNGLPFDLTLGWAERELASAVEGGCPLLGIGIRLDAAKVTPGSPSIDKFDPARGYTQGNCWVISHRANTMKQDASPEFMRRILECAATRFAVDRAA